MIIASRRETVFCIEVMNPAMVIAPTIAVNAQWDEALSFEEAKVI